MDRSTITRRQLALGTLAGVAVARAGATRAQSPEGPSGNRVRHSVARWTFGDMPLPELCNLASDIGMQAIDLVGPEDWHVLRNAGLDSSMCNSAEPNLTDGFADPQFHDALVQSYERHIDLVAEAGYRNLILFSGNGRGIDPGKGLVNAEAGIKRILRRAEQRGVVLQMELLNSKVDHPGYMADNSPWGVELCNRLGSENFRLLYDIYHMQIMEGDVIRTIRDHGDCFGHYHTAGVPGRHEIGEDQELRYPAIVRAIQETGFDGYLAQEFIPSAADMQTAGDALRDAVEICTV
ncbi:hydroxypyruvate isomerase family protein [Allosediminivita pacifica]|uniref:Hydroxypyruvate isomerase n=1 Tax=Allosediminivita pacifica TaxID=1267769 RepID=A0A2T6AU99_9RHOB|nr:TIM barrel protein [Allosediminivita pacifica]PTX47394.1 hydroxypyruvate isomerase [Allosediminivita pacifica]GGB13917.1 hydroxypyruvate isomerase [Allosediminivita pacifica]